MVLFGLGPIALLGIVIGTILSARIPEQYELFLWAILVPAALLASAVYCLRKSNASTRGKNAFLTAYTLTLAMVGYFNFHTIRAIWAVI